MNQCNNESMKLYYEFKFLLLVLTILYIISPNSSALSFRRYSKGYDFDFSHKVSQYLVSSSSFSAIFNLYPF